MSSEPEDAQPPGAWMLALWFPHYRNFFLRSNCSICASECRKCTGSISKRKMWTQSCVSFSWGSQRLLQNTKRQLLRILDSGLYSTNQRSFCRLASLIRPQILTPRQPTDWMLCGIKYWRWTKRNQTWWSLAQASGKNFLSAWSWCTAGQLNRKLWSITPTQTGPWLPNS